MSSRFTAPNLAGTVTQLCAIIARCGLARGLAGPLIILIWQRVRTAGTQVEAILARMQAGTLRRHPHRRAAPRGTPHRRQCAAKRLPHRRGWAVALIPEAAGNASQLQLMLADPEIPALLHSAPQLRRALRPLCHMLGVSLPRAPTLPPPPEPPPSDPPPPASWRGLGESVTRGPTLVGAYPDRSDNDTARAAPRHHGHRRRPPWTQERRHHARRGRSHGPLRPRAARA